MKNFITLKSGEIIEMKNLLKIILNAYLRLAVSYAKKYKSYGLPLDDLIHEGVLGHNACFRKI